MIVSLVSLMIAVALELWFVFSLNLGAIGIAWAQVIWSVIELAILFTLIVKRLPKLFNHHFWLAFVRIVMASALTGVITYIMVKLYGLQFNNQNMLMVLLPLSLIGLVSSLSYLGLSYLFKLEEASPVINYLKRLLSGTFMLKGKK